MSDLVEPPKIGFLVSWLISYDNFSSFFSFDFILEVEFLNKLGRNINRNCYECSCEHHDPVPLCYLKQHALMPSFMYVQ